MTVSEAAQLGLGKLLNPRIPRTRPQLAGLSSQSTVTLVRLKYQTTVLNPYLLPTTSIPVVTTHSIINVSGSQ